MQRTNPTAEAMQTAKIDVVIARLSAIVITIEDEPVPIGPQTIERLGATLDTVMNIRQLAEQAEQAARDALSIEGERQS